MKLELLFVPLVLSACGHEDSPSPPAARERVVMATSYPIAWVAERLCEPDVDVVLPLPSGADPVFWQPSREELERYRRAALVVANGARFEHWISLASLPASRLVQSADGFPDEWLRYRTQTHSHGPHGKHTHQGVDGHTFMDPALLKRQARAVQAALARAFPELDTRERMRALEHDLDELGDELEGLGQELAGVDLIASHPAWNYLLRLWGREASSVPLDPEAPLDPKDLETLRAALHPGRPAVVLWELPPPEDTVARLEELGVRSAVYSPGESPPPDGSDWLSLQRQNVARLRAAARP